jgi:hypothetical protein
VRLPTSIPPRCNIPITRPPTDLNHPNVTCLPLHCRTVQSLVYALQRYGPGLVSQINDLVASFGMDPEVGALTDREYAAAMQASSTEG